MNDSTTPATDPGYVDLILPGTLDPHSDPLQVEFGGVARHGNTLFETTVISHIVGNLYQGGFDPSLSLPPGIKHVVSLYQWGRWRRDEGVTLAEVEMYDSGDEPDRENVIALAKLVRENCQDGPTLVHCQAGLNRSSLIAGAALVLDGYSPEAAIDLIRKRRSPACLCNQTFERFLRNFRPSAAEVDAVPTASVIDE